MIVVARIFRVRLRRATSGANEQVVPCERSRWGRPSAPSPGSGLPRRQVRRPQGTPAIAVGALQVAGERQCPMRTAALGVTDASRTRDALNAFWISWRNERSTRIQGFQPLAGRPSALFGEIRCEMSFERPAGNEITQTAA